MSTKTGLEEALIAALVKRDIPEALRLLDQRSAHKVFESLCPDTEHAYSLLVLRMILIDAAGSPGPLNVTNVFKRFLDDSHYPPDQLSDFTLLRMAQGLHEMVGGRFAGAIDCFKILKKLPLRFTVPFYKIILDYFLGRCLARSAQYEQADGCYHQAVEECEKQGFKALGFVITSHRAWTSLQMNKMEEALNILYEVEKHVPESDPVARANVQSTFARIHRRRSTDLEKVIECYKGADERLREFGFENHPNRARILVQMAVSERHLALRKGDELERSSDSNRRRNLLAESLKTVQALTNSDSQLKQLAEKADVKSYMSILSQMGIDDRMENDKGAEGRAAERKDVIRELTGLRQSSRGHLEKARDIYAGMNHTRAGIAEVHLGYLDLDEGAYEEAAKKARHVEGIGEKNKDLYLKVNATVLKNMTYHEMIEEEMESPTLSTLENYIQEAQRGYDEARSLQNDRLTFTALVALGLALYDAKNTDEVKKVYSEVLRMKAALKIQAGDTLLWNFSKLKTVVDSLRIEGLEAIVSFCTSDILNESLDDEKARSARRKAEAEFEECLVREVCKLAPPKMSNAELARRIGGKRQRTHALVRKYRPPKNKEGLGKVG